MSEQPGGLLEHSKSFQFNQQTVESYKGDKISPNKFQMWVKDSMYKSSYAQFHSQESAQPNSSLIPGYSGFVPKARSESLHGKGFSNVSKEILKNPSSTDRITGIATTGFNVNKQALIDQSKIGSTSKYGQSALQKPHPGWNAKWTTSTQETYSPPKDQVDPTYRPTQKGLQTEKQGTKRGGFLANSDFFDGYGWKPDPKLSPTKISSQYRDRFNQEVQFHRSNNAAKERRMKPAEMVYLFNR